MKFNKLAAINLLLLLCAISVISVCGVALVFANDVSIRIISFALMINVMLLQVNGKSIFNLR